MSLVLPGMTAAQLETLADAVERGQIDQPTQTARSQFVSAESAAAVDEVTHLHTALGHHALAILLRSVAAERRAATQSADRRLELVWTGPERDGAGTRDTGVVVRELFLQAERYVLISGFAVFGGRSIFEPLVDRMRARPTLHVRLCLNVSRAEHDQRDNAAIAVEFGRRFCQTNWPVGPLPQLYFDPRSLERRPDRRAVLHAKCVVIDDLRAFTTSANLTEAAQSRNIEAGVLINDPMFAGALRLQFDSLIARNDLSPIPLG